MDEEQQEYSVAGHAAWLKITIHELMPTLAHVLTLQCTWPTHPIHVSNTEAVSALIV
jgi:hypothetical protein